MSGDVLTDRHCAGIVLDMSDYSHVKEFWTISTRRGPRAYYWSNRAFRALPIPHAVAEMLESTEQAQRTEKPEWVGRSRGW